MSEYHISQIFPEDLREMKQLEALLTQEGIEQDKNLDYTVGLYDDSYRLAATGSCFKNTLRCLAVDSGHQGEGLLNQLVTHLVHYQFCRNYNHLFLYTKCDKALYFKDLGFHEIARVEGKVVFMENKKNGFSDYLKRLEDEAREQHPAVPEEPVCAGQAETGQPHFPAGAVIMNANPFTLGHLYLLETASAACGLLHVFVVSEDASLVPPDIRFRLIKEGSAHLTNLVYHKTDSYLISSATFPSYFLKDSDTVIHSHATLDVTLFEKISKQLKISARFLGEEPNSHVTGMYNQIMKEQLPAAGITCIIIPRKTGPEGVISASTVRQLIHDRRLSDMRSLVPDSTYRYFASPEADALIQKIRAQEEVVHY